MVARRPGPQVHPQSGDRVRVVIEGDVDYADKLGRHFDIGSARFWTESEKLVSVEVLPKPIKVGDLLREDHTLPMGTVIVAKTTLQEAIKRTDVPNLDVLTCGPVPPNPSELLHTERFGAVLADCAKLYDRIILDSPPTSAVTDPAVLGNLADGVVLVIKAGETTRESAIHARRQLTSANARLLGVVVNAIDFSNPAYGYDYYYRNYYRYGYTYGNGPDQKASTT